MSCTKGCVCFKIQLYCHHSVLCCTVLYIVHVLDHNFLSPQCAVLCNVSCMFWITTFFRHSVLCCAMCCACFGSQLFSYSVLCCAMCRACFGSHTHTHIHLFRHGVLCCAVPYRHANKCLHLRVLLLSMGHFGVAICVGGGMGSIARDEQAHGGVSALLRCVATRVGLARTAYIRCMYGIFGREITNNTVIYDLYKYTGSGQPLKYSTR